jgi:type I restriction enzyme S subunit
MELKQGYKQTEVGVIPEDWKIEILNDLTTRIGDGIHSTPKYSNNGEYYFVNGNNLVNGKIIVSNDTKKVSNEEYHYHKRELNDSTILISINGTIGNIALYGNENILIGKSAAYLNLNNKIKKLFLYQVLQSKFINRYFENELTGSTIKNIY